MATDSRKKKMLLSETGTTYWDINTSLCTFHNIDPKIFGKDLFNVCHKIIPKINAFHIQGPTTSGKTFILKSIVDGLLNCGTIRTEKSDSFCFGSCTDKSLIYTDELWFSKENVELAKCVLEGSKVLVNVKHQSERLIERTPCLSTSNNDIWNVVPHEEQPLRHRMIIYKTKQKMGDLKEWGICKINPLMWLTIWRDHINSLVNNTYKKSLIVKRKPKRSHLFEHDNIDTLSPNKSLKQDDEQPTSPHPHDDNEETLSPDIIDTQPSPVPYVASPSWVIPDSYEEKINEQTLPSDVISTLINEELKEKCILNSEQEGQECVNHGPNYYRDICSVTFSINKKTVEN